VRPSDADEEIVAAQCMLLIDHILAWAQALAYRLSFTLADALMFPVEAEGCRAARQRRLTPMLRLVRMQHWPLVSACFRSWQHAALYPDDRVLRHVTSMTVRRLEIASFCLSAWRRSVMCERGAALKLFDTFGWSSTEAGSGSSSQSSRSSPAAVEVASRLLRLETVRTSRSPTMLHIFGVWHTLALTLKHARRRCFVAEKWFAASTQTELLHRAWRGWLHAYREGERVVFALSLLSCQTAFGPGVLCKLLGATFVAWVATCSKAPAISLALAALLHRIYAQDAELCWMVLLLWKLISSKAPKQAYGAQSALSAHSCDMLEAWRFRMRSSNSQLRSKSSAMEAPRILIACYGALDQIIAVLAVEAYAANLKAPSMGRSACIFRIPLLPDLPQRVGGSRCDYVGLMALASCYVDMGPTSCGVLSLWEDSSLPLESSLPQEDVKPDAVADVVAQAQPPPEAVHAGTKCKGRKQLKANKPRKKAPPPHACRRGSARSSGAGGDAKLRSEALRSEEPPSHQTASTAGRQEELRPRSVVSDVALELPDVQDRASVVEIMVPALRAAVEMELGEALDEGQLDRVERMFAAVGRGDVHIEESKEEGKRYAPGFISGLVPNKPFHETEPIPWCKRLESKWREIRAEVDSNLSDERLWQPGIYTEAAVAEDKEWKLSGVLLDGEWRRAVWPRTVDIVRDLQDFSTSFTPHEVFFARLPAGTSIAAHSDNLNYILTACLTLVAPLSQECRLRVGCCERPHEEGKVLVFDTTYIHSAQNDSAKDRYALIVRYWHPDLSSEERLAIEYANALLSGAVSSSGCASGES